MDFCRPLPVGNDIDGTSNGDGRPQMPCQRCCQVRVSRSDAAVDAEILTALMGGQTGDFRSIAADDGQGQFVQQALRSLGPESRAAGADGVEDDGNAVSRSGPASCHHGFQRPLLERSQIEDQGLGGGRHFSDFLDGIGHGRRGADGQGRIGAVGHGDEISDVVDEGPLAAQFLKGLGHSRDEFHRQAPFQT